MCRKCLLFWCTVALVIVGCAAGYRFKAGVDVSITKVVSDSTRTVSVTKSASYPDSS